MMFKHFILDTNVLVRYPEVLAMASGNNLIIPQVVLDQFKQRRLRGIHGDVQEVIDDAINKGVHVAPSPSQLIEEPVASARDTQRLDQVDMEIARVAKYYSELDGKASVCLVTADKFLAKFLLSYGIKSIGGAQFLDSFRSAGVDRGIELTARNIVSKQRRYLIASFSLGIVVAMLGTVIFNNLQLLISTISTWGTLLVLPILGVSLYWYREHYRLSYGAFEFVAGIIMAYYVLFPNFDYSSVNAVKIIQILAGLYVMVRGLDNIGKCVEGTRLEQFWKRFFGQ